MRNRYVLAADLVVFVLAAAGAFVLRFDWWFYRDRREFPAFLIGVVLLKPIVFYGFGLYRRYWRYTGLHDLKALTLATAAASVTMTIYVWLAINAQAMPLFSRPLLVIDGILTLLGAAGIRVSIRVIGESRARSRGAHRTNGGKPPIYAKRAMIVGAGEAGAMVVREMRRNPQLGLMPVGFLDDDPIKVGKQIYGVEVLGDIASLKKTVRSVMVDEVLIAMPTASGGAVRTIVETCQRLNIPSRIIPGVFELLDGQVTLSRLRHVDIADLLRRRQVVGDMGARTYLHGRTVLITGAGGSIGYELCRQVAYARPSRLVMLGHGENSLFESHAQLTALFPAVPVEVVVADVRDGARIRRVFAEHAPQVVFHAAAHKHVHLMERHPEEAILNNVVGTHNVVEAALSTRTEQFVAISSDKAVSPTGMMGASKRLADMIVHDAGRRSDRPFVVVRFGNVLGSRGSVVPFFKKQIDRGGPITITHPDMRRFFMTISEAVHLVLEAGGMGRPAQLFVLNMGEPVKIVNLAEDLVRLSGFSTEQIPIVFTGIRPGEKLEESLWESDSLVEPTANPDILRVTERHALRDVRSAVHALEQLAREGRRFEIQAMLCDLIPTYTPFVTSHGADVH